jgi:apolipoprotein N-acyltransferase
MTDPGNMNQDNKMSIWLKVSSILAGIVGVIILSMLIAFITTSLEKVLYNFRKGRGVVIEDEHTLILG